MGGFGHLINIAATKLRLCKSKIFSVLSVRKLKNGMEKQLMRGKIIQLILLPIPE